MASANAHLASEYQQHTATAEEMEIRENILKSQLQDKVGECRNIQMSFAVVVREKEQLIREVHELRGICEELLRIVESGGKN